MSEVSALTFLLAGIVKGVVAIGLLGLVMMPVAGMLVG